ncbi:MAG: type I-C CRISPR-associated protein Cas7/Csd2 [Firmicutes bacterium]|nr:type I-C CRISPR-associated protein Cas7/Csd2 [Bacillota bacterium]
MTEAIKNRYEFVLLFDVENGNPNGDPDAGNMPRIDAETGHGLVTDVCLKRKIRNYVEILKDGAPGYDIYVREGAVLNIQHRKAYDKLGIKPEPKKLPKKEEEARQLTEFMCQNFFDIRTFGAVMTTEVNCGQVRGPVQLNFARSIDPIVQQEVTITRMAVTSEKDAEKKDREMGRKHIIPYGLYRVEGFVSANLAQKTTGFSTEDLYLLWDALNNMFDHDHSAARGKMCARKLIVFEHESSMGNAPAHKLFDLVKVVRKDPSQPARSYSDYEISIDTAGVPVGVKMIAD